MSGRSINPPQSPSATSKNFLTAPKLHQPPQINLNAKTSIYTRTDVDSSPAGSEVTDSPESTKKMKLRDYLFMAKNCSQRKRPLVKTKSHKDIPAVTERTSKSPRFEIETEEMQEIIKKQISRDLREMMTLLSAKCQQVQNKDSFKGKSEKRLAELYEMRRIIQDKLKPAVRGLTRIGNEEDQNTLPKMFEMARKGSEFSFLPDSDDLGNRQQGNERNGMENSKTILPWDL